MSNYLDKYKETRDDLLDDGSHSLLYGNSSHGPSLTF